MADKTDPINTLNPAGDSDPKQGDDYIRTLAKALIELLTVDHYVGVANPWGSDASGDETGEHAKVMFHEAISDPSVAAGKGVLFIKGTPPELYFRDEDDGDVIQLTNGGIVNLTSAALLGILANDAYFTGVDYAGTGTVNLIKVGTNDLATLPDSAEMASNAAPEEDEAIANKKYVDDQIAAAFPDDDAFGTRTDKDSGGSSALAKDEVYKVGSDGFVCTNFANQNSQCQHDIKIGDTVSVDKFTYTQGGGRAENNSASLTVSIPKDWYWKLTIGSGNLESLNWLPIGSGTCVKQ